MPNSKLGQLYQQVILDHSRNPRNYGCLECPTHSGQGFNPLCGDKIELTLQIEDGHVQDIRFHGEGCSISQASASMMTQALLGKPLAEAEALFNEFQQMVTGKLDTEHEPHQLQKLTIFAGVKAYPSRIKCAILPWHTLQAALRAAQEPVITE